MRRPTGQGWALPLLTGISMLVTGMMESMKGFLPDFFLREYQFDTTTSGLIFACSFAGLMAANGFAGFVTVSWGWQRAYMRHQIVFAAGMALLAELSSTSAAVWCGLFFMIGYANGIVGMICNVALPLASPERAGQLLGRLHFFLGSGFILGPLVYTYLFREGALLAPASGWSLVLGLFALCGIGMAGVARTLSWPDSREDSKAMHAHSEPVSSLERGTTSGIQVHQGLMFVCFGMLYFCYVGAEVGFTVWFRPLLISYYELNPSSATFWFSAAFAGFTAARLGVSQSLKRWGYGGSLKLCTVLGVISLAVGVLGPGKLGAAGYTAFLISIAMIFPIVTAMAVQLWGELAASRMGWFFACGFAGGSCATWLIGMLQQKASVQEAFYVVAYLFIGFIFALFWIRMAFMNRFKLNDRSESL